MTNRVASWWTRQSLYVQLALLCSIVITGTMVAHTYYSIANQTAQAKERMFARVAALTSSVSNAGAYQILEDDLASLEDLLLKSAAYPDVLSIRVFDTQGWPLGSVQRDSQGRVQADYDPIPVPLPEGLDSATGPYTTVGEDVVTIWQRVETVRPLGWVTLRYGLDSLAQIELQVWRDNVLAAFVTAGFNVLILLVILRPPVSALHRATAFADRLRRIEGSRLHLPPVSREVNDLVAALNETSGQLASQHQTILANQRNLQRLTEELESAKQHLERRVAERTEQLSWQATHDPLTTLSNRFEFERRLNELINSAVAEKKHHAMCYLDLDQFKVVNDTCGHVAGDDLLRQISAVLKERIREADTLARLGGDEFGILLEGCSLDEAARLAADMLHAIQRFRFSWADKSFNVGASIGVVAIGPDAAGIADVMSNADMACYAAKEKGRNAVHVYHADDDELAKRRGEMRWISYIHSALENNRFFLVRQPILPITADPQLPHHYEVLLRAMDDKGQWFKPAAFLPAAERYNLMPAIDRWVVDTTFRMVRQQTEWLGDGSAGVMVSINLSGSSLGDGQFAQFIIDGFSHYGLDPRQVCFEITETAVIANLANAVAFIRELRSIGCRFALDDFGTGLSSFSYLKALTVDYIKIDGSFIRNMHKDALDYAIVESVNNLAHALNLETVAEFVEGEDVLEKLRELGVDYVQGYAVASPEPLCDIAHEVAVAGGGRPF